MPRQIYLSNSTRNTLFITDASGIGRGHLVGTVAPAAEVPSSIAGEIYMRPQGSGAPWLYWSHGTVATTYRIPTLAAGSTNEPTGSIWFSSDGTLYVARNGTRYEVGMEPVVPTGSCYDYGALHGHPHRRFMVKTTYSDGSCSATWELYSGPNECRSGEEASMSGARCCDDGYSIRDCVEVDDPTPDPTTTTTTTTPPPQYCHDCGLSTAPASCGGPDGTEPSWCWAG